VIRVWIVAPSSFARSGLQNLVVSRRISVAGTSADFGSFPEEILDNEPDAVVIHSSGENTQSILDALTTSGLAAETSVIVLLDQSRPEWTAEALRAGVRAVLPSSTPADQLTAALEAAVAGFFILHPSELASTLASATAPSALDELPEPLTPREREVLQRLASGLANKQIADQLHISEHTVKFHVASILGKLGASTRTEAVSLGIRHGLVLL
jgi:two-component system, NarL family, response regulator YdfI